VRKTTADMENERFGNAGAVEKGVTLLIEFAPWSRAEYRCDAVGNDPYWARRPVASEESILGRPAGDDYGRSLVDALLLAGHDVGGIGGCNSELLVDEVVYHNDRGVGRVRRPRKVGRDP